MKKRVSNRLTRPGGVIARAIRNRLEGSGSRPASANGFQAPSSFAFPSVLRPRQRPVSSQASRIAAIASDLAREAGLRAALGEIGFQLGGDGCCTRHAVIVLVDAAAGEDELSGHEHHLVVALADQDFRTAAAIDQDQRRRIAGAEIGMVVGFLAFVDLGLLGSLRRIRHVLTQTAF